MLCDCVAACGEGLDPAACHFLLDQLLEEGWTAFCLCPVALAVQQVRPFQVVVVKVVLTLWVHCMLDGISSRMPAETPCFIRSVSCASGSCMRAAKACRRLRRSGWPEVTRRQSACEQDGRKHFCAICQVQLLLVRERVRVDALCQMMHNVRGEVVLRGVLLPVLNKVLKGAGGFWIGVICCTSEAGAVAYWGPAMHDWLAQQIGEVGDAGFADACLRAERLQERC